MTIYLVRHGKDDETVRGGWSNHSLTPEGIEQVEKLAEKMVSKNTNIDCINYGEAETPKQIADRSICINADISSVLNGLI